jgi:hypothetical protein
MVTRTTTRTLAGACGIGLTALAVVPGVTFGLEGTSVFETHAGGSPAVAARQTINQDRKGDRLAIKRGPKITGSGDALLELAMGRPSSDLVVIRDSAGALRFVVDARRGLTVATERPPQDALMPDPFDEPARPQRPPSPTVPFGCEPVASSTSDPRIAGLAGKCMSDAAAIRLYAARPNGAIHLAALD